MSFHPNYAPPAAPCLSEMPRYAAVIESQAELKRIYERIGEIFERLYKVGVSADEDAFNEAAEKVDEALASLPDETMVRED